MSLLNSFGKGVKYAGIVPLAVLLTGCPEKLPKDFSIENIQKIRQMKCDMEETPVEPYKIDAYQLRSDLHISPGVGITFKAWC